MHMHKSAALPSHDRAGIGSDPRVVAYERHGMPSHASQSLFPRLSANFISVRNVSSFFARL